LRHGVHRIEVVPLGGQENSMHSPFRPTRTGALRGISAVVLVAGLCSGFDACGEGGESTSPCSFEGEPLALGQSVPASDGCNTCSCTSSGLACTEIACGPAPHSCSYDGETYLEGATFPKGDGCNQCSCASDGQVECTEEGCDQDGGRPCLTEDCGPKTCKVGTVEHALGDVFESGCSSCKCTEDGVLCQEKDCPVEEQCRMGDALFPRGSYVVWTDSCNNCLCDDDFLNPAGPPVFACSLKDCVPSPLGAVELCPGATQSVAPAKRLYLKGDRLAVSLGEGCQQAFRLCTTGAFRESNPVQVEVWVEAKDKQAECDAPFERQRVFDLTLLKQRYQESYGGETGSLDLKLGSEAIHYSF
jgi:hypothetical protein